MQENNEMTKKPLQKDSLMNDNQEALQSISRIRLSRTPNCIDNKKDQNGKQSLFKKLIGKCNN